MVQIVRKKKGRPSKADLARRLAGESPAKEPEVRRSHRRRNARFGVIDYDDFIDDDDEEEEEFRAEEDDREENLKLRLVVKLTRDEAAVDSEEEDSDGKRKRKKRRIDGIDDGDDDDDDGDGDGIEGDDDDEEEESARKVDPKRLDSVSDEPKAAIPLPDKKILEMILDKLQKKDTYGVYADPVDPEELPDYHDVIEHPMDFATVRKRLSDGFYSTLEQLESDVFLICSNAMQYNSSDTVYHKQARNIQELGRKKFKKLRIKFRNSEREMKLAQKLKSNSTINKFNSPEEEPKSAQKIKSCSSVKKHIRKPLYRTSQENAGSDFSSGATLATAGEILNSMNLTPDKPANNDSNADILNDVNLDKAEETSSARGNLPKLGRKPANLEDTRQDNRRGTYSISTQPVEKPESVFTTFESEMKQFVAVGLHAEYAYARSLARFAATLGPIAWKAASRKIEQALPFGCKFGRGWVGEYEPLPTPVLQLETNKQKPPGNSAGEKMRKNERPFKASAAAAKEKSDTGNFSEGRQSMFVSTKSRDQNTVQPKAIIFPKQEIVSPMEQRKKQPDPKSEKPFSRPFSNGKDTRSNGNSAQATKSTTVEKLPPPPPPTTTTAAAAAARAWMSIGAGPFKPPPESLESPYNHPPQFQSQPQIARIRAEFPGQQQFHSPEPRNGFSVPAAFFPQAVHFQSRPPLMFPQQVPADLSRFQIMQSLPQPPPPTWQHEPPPQWRQRQANLPPDLNIGFQPPPSPVKQSSGGGGGVMVESQHPDLALQL